MTIEELKIEFPDKILDYPYPKAYPSGMVEGRNIKGIVLGCDPSNFSNPNGTTNELDTVFGLHGKGKDARYFAAILKNLNRIGLNPDNIYVQNLCQNYFTSVTNDNDIWHEAARIWAVYLKKELTDLGIPENVPVFLTSAHLYHALMKEGIVLHKPKDFYLNKPTLIPIKAEDNLLGRPLIPLYRGGGQYYSLDNWTSYTNTIISLL